jgi:hypothetical protein
VFIEFVKYETHTIHETVHVSRLALRVPCAAVRRKGSLEHFKVLHPLQRKVMRLNISLIEDENEGQFCFVKDTMFRYQHMLSCGPDEAYLQA